MASINQVIFDIREALKDYSDDSELSNEYILYLLNIKRAKYLKQRIDQLGRSYNNRVLQTLCLETEEVSINECGLDFDCETIIRTKKPLPQLLQLSTKDALQRVSPSDKLSIKFNLINRERATGYMNSPFNNKIKAFLHDDNHIYLIGNPMPLLLECISVTGVFEDPTELENYSNCCGCNLETSKCFDYDTTEYPIQIDLLDIIRTDVIQEIAKLKQIKEEQSNNSNDDQ